MLKIKNISIRGISTTVPNQRIDNRFFLQNDEKRSFIKHTGVKYHHLANKNSKLTTSDLCIESSLNLIKKIKWQKDEIKFVVFVSQTRDYILPSTACIIQNKLGLSNETITLDIPYGCSGFVYGLYVSSLIANNSKSNGLLLCGDMSSQMINPEDQKMLALFGDAGSAIAIEYNKNFKYESIFVINTDGSGEKNLLLEGEFSKRKKNNSLDQHKFLKMNGPEIFQFGINEVPKQINSILKKSKVKIDDIDYFVFHQANHFIIKAIAKKMKINSKKILISIDLFGNTNSASIPLTINKHKKLFHNKTKKILICGFGVGYSWGTSILTVDKLNCSNIKKLKNV